MSRRQKKSFWFAVIIIAISLAFISTQARTRNLLSREVSATGASQSNYDALKTGKANSVVIPIFANPALTQESVTQKSPAPDRLEAERVIVRSTGIETGEINHSAGRFLLVIHNYAALDEIVLRLKDEEGNLLREFRMPKGRTTLEQVMTLLPGHYTLTEANHPQWICRITIAT